VFPSLLQLHRGITDVEDRKQKHLCATKYKPKELVDKGKSSEIDVEKEEEECDICMEITSIVILPNCNHSMCIKCYRDWWVTCDYLFFLWRMTLMIIRLNNWMEVEYTG